MPQRRFYKISNARNQQELIRELNTILRDLSEKLLRVEGREGLKPEFASSIPMNNQRITDLGKPIDPNDAVRLRDLVEFNRATNQELRFLSSTVAGFGSAASSATLGNLRFHVGFAEPTNGVRYEFTPLEAPAIEPDGRPSLVLVHRGLVLHCIGVDATPAPPGTWTWLSASGMIAVNPDHAPIPGAHFEIAVMVTAT